MEAIDLTLQAAGDDRLTAFLISPAGTHAFQVEVPAELAQRHQAWLRRFLAHHDPASPALPADVVHRYGAGLVAAMAEWLQRSDWEPLQQVLAARPDLPLRLRCSGPLSLIERLPWEALPLERPIWRLDGPGSLAGDHSQPRHRLPRLLLLVGQEDGLDLAADIEALERLAGQRRIELRSLRGAASCPAGLHEALSDRLGWDVLVFLGHSAGDPQGGGRLQLGDGHWLGGQSLARALQPPPQRRQLSLVLLNSCSGMDLARSCTAAGVPWALCFREAVPTRAASLAFAELLGAMERGLGFSAALEQVRHALETSGPAGCHLLLSGLCAGNAADLELPLSRRRRFRLRLARSTPRQAIAAGVLVALGAGFDLIPTTALGTYLLDRRLYVQRLWRQATAQPGPRTKPLPVLLLDEARAYPALGVQPTPGRVARAALAEVLRRTSPAAVPVVGLDVVLDEPAPHTADLAAAIRSQQPRRVFAGWFGPGAGAPSAGTRSKPLAELQEAGLEWRDLGVGTPAGDQRRQPPPLRLLWEVNQASFAAGLLPPAQAQAEGAPRLPADAVIDWSIAWQPLIEVVSVAELPALQAPALVVGTDGTIDAEQHDLFTAPGAIRPALAAWGGSTDAIPGALVQAVLAQSLAMGHWLRPVSMAATTALAGGLGVVLAAALPRRRHRLLAVAGITAAALPINLQVATAARLLIPAVLPLTALAATTLLRRD